VTGERAAYQHHTHLQHEDHANTKGTLGAVFIRMRAQSRGLLSQLTDHKVGGSAMDEEATAYGSRKEELAGVKPIASELLSHENM
jgi:hypothetical protein